MNVSIALLIGALMDALNGVAIFFEPREPYNVEILLAATVKTALISLSTGFSLSPRNSRKALSNLKTLRVVPMSVVTGFITRVLLPNFAF